MFKLFLQERVKTRLCIMFDGLRSIIFCYDKFWVRTNVDNLNDFENDKSYFCKTSKRYGI